LGIKEGELGEEVENSGIGASSDSISGIVVALKAGLVEA